MKLIQNATVLLRAGASELPSAPASNFKSVASSFGGKARHDNDNILRLLSHGGGNAPSRGGPNGDCAGYVNDEDDRKCFWDTFKEGNDLNGALPDCPDPADLDTFLSSPGATSTLCGMWHTCNIFGQDCNGLRDDLCALSTELFCGNCPDCTDPEGGPTHPWDYFRQQCGSSGRFYSTTECQQYNTCLDSGAGCTDLRAELCLGYSPGTFFHHAFCQDCPDCVPPEQGLHLQEEWLEFQDDCQFAGSYETYPCVTFHLCLFHGEGCNGPPDDVLRPRICSLYPLANFPFCGDCDACVDPPKGNEPNTEDPPGLSFSQACLSHYGVESHRPNVPAFHTANSVICEWNIFVESCELFNFGGACGIYNECRFLGIGCDPQLGVNICNSFPDQFFCDEEQRFTCDESCCGLGLFCPAPDILEAEEAWEAFQDECAGESSADIAACTEYNSCVNDSPDCGNLRATLCTQYGPTNDVYDFLFCSVCSACTNPSGNQCLQPNNFCRAQNKHCINNGGSISCGGCLPGYRKVFSFPTFNCVDINECMHYPCGANSRCTNIPGSYRCACLPGYRSPTGNGRNCRRIDPCEGNPCGHGNCVASGPGYNCICARGFVFNGVTCIRSN